MKERTPFILQLLKLPFWIIKLTVNLVGLLACFPIYIYGLITNPIIFNPKFETSKGFYVAFCIPRALMSLGTFITCGGEFYLVYWSIIQFLKFESWAEMAITLSSIIGFISVSSRFGYLLIKNTFGFPEIKGIKDHLTIILYGIQDTISALLTIVTIMLVFRAKEILQYKFEPNKRLYLRFASSKFWESLLDSICLPFWIIIIVTYWRFSFTKNLVHRMKPMSQKRFVVIYQGINVIFDIIFIPPLAISLLNPFLKGKRLIYHMSKLSVRSWRKLILDEFISTLFDVIPFLCFMVSLASMYEIPSAWVLYKTTILKAKPFLFDDNEVAICNNDDDPQKIKALQEKVYSHNIQYEMKCRYLYIVLLGLVIIDFMVLLANLSLMLSVYRFAIHARKIETLKLSIEQRGEEKKAYETLTYSEYRKYLKSIFSMEFDIKESNIKFSKYPWSVLSEALELIMDIPFIILGVLLILAPWRAKKVIRQAKGQWDDLRKIENINKRFAIRLTILNEIIMANVDYICFVFFLLGLIAFWRVNLIMKDFKKIVQSDLRNAGKHSWKLISHVINGIIDFIYIPLLLITILNPFLKGRRLIYHMYKFPVLAWRKLIVDEFSRTLLDILPIICLLLSIITVLEIPNALALYKATIKKCKAISFDNDNDKAAQDADYNPQEINEIYQRVYEHNVEHETNYRTLYFLLLPLIVVDYLLLISNILLLISVYRYLILQKKLKNIKAELEAQGQQKMNSHVFSYMEYRNLTYRVLSMKIMLQESYLPGCVYPLKVFAEIPNLLADLPFVVVCPLLLIAPWRGKKVLKEAQTQWQNLGKVNNIPPKYSLRSLIVSEIIMGLLDYVCFIFLVISLIAFWRVKMQVHDLKKILEATLFDVGQRHTRFIIHSLDSILDILFIPPLLIAILNPFIKGRRLLHYMRKFPIFMWRQLIIGEFVDTLFDIPSFLFMILSFVTILEIPITIRLYKAILQKSKPIIFADDDDALCKAGIDIDKVKKLYNKVSDHNRKDEQQCRHLCLLLVPLIFIDAALLVSKLILLLSVYRNIMLKKKLQNKKIELEINQQLDKERDIFTYSEYRNLLSDIFSMNKPNDSNFSNYPWLVISETALLIFDLPFIIISPLLILFPWRGRKVIKEAQSQWNNIGKLSTNIPNTSLRLLILDGIIMGALDYVCIVFFSISLVAFWRVKVMSNDLKAIFGSNLSNVGLKHLSLIIRAFDSLLDIFFLPLFLVVILSPFLKGRRLIYHMQKFSVLAWRGIVLDEFISTLLDFPALICFILAILSIYEIPVALTLFKATIQEIKPIPFDNDDDKAAQNVERNIQELREIYNKIQIHNYEQQKRYQRYYFKILPLLLIDLLLLLSNVLLVVSVYRYMILQKKLKNIKTEFEEKDQKKNNSDVFTFSEYRDQVHRFFSMKIHFEENFLASCVYSLEVFSQIPNLFIDLPFIVISPLVVVAPWRAKKVLTEAYCKWQNLGKDDMVLPSYSLRKTVVSEIIMGLLDYVCFLFFLISLLAFWRVKIIIQDLKCILKANLFDVGHKHAQFIIQVLDTILDVLLIPPLLVALLNPFLKGRRLIDYMFKIPAVIWRRLVFDEFISTLVDVPAFICLVLSVVTIVEIPTAFELYKIAMQQTRLIEFNIDDKALCREDIDLQKLHRLYEKIYIHNRKSETRYQILCYKLNLFGFINLLLLVAKLLLLISVYRNAILQQKFKNRKADIERIHGVIPKYAVFSYSDYRALIFDIFTMKAEINKEDPSLLLYPSIVFSETLQLLFDLPFVVLSLLLLITPWRVKHVVKKAQFEWQNLGKLEVPERNLSLRQFILTEIIMGLIDYICFIFFLISSLAFWRIKVMLTDLKTILNSSLSDIQNKQLTFIFQAFDSLFDLVFIPLLLVSIFNPFLKARRLINHMTNSPVLIWRKLILDEFFITLMDIPAFICFLLAFITLLETTVALKLYKATLSLTKPINPEVEDGQASQNDEQEAKNLVKIIQKIRDYNKKQDLAYRTLYYNLMRLFLVDLLLLLCHILLGVSVYRFAIFQKKAMAQKLAQENKEGIKTPFSLSEYRNIIHQTFSMEIHIKETESLLFFYPKIIFSEVGGLIMDLPFIIISPLLLLAPWRIKHVIKEAKYQWEIIGKPQNAPYTLRIFVLCEILIGFVDYVLFLFFIASVIAFWRINLRLKRLKVLLGLSSLGPAHIDFVLQTFESLYDFIFILPLLVALLNPFLKGRRLVYHMFKLSVLTWRRLIMDEFSRTIRDIPAFLCFLLSLITIIEIPIAFALYKATYWRTKPQLFNKKEEEPTNSERLHEYFYEVQISNNRHEAEYRTLCYMLVPLGLIDILLLFSYILLGTSVYRLAIFHRKVGTNSLAFKEKQESHALLTFKEYREFIKKVFSMDVELKQADSVSFTYLWMLFSEIPILFLDLFFIAMSFLLLAVPWRIKYVVKRAQNEWENLGKINKEPQVWHFSLRLFILCEIIMGILDYVCFIFFLGSLAIFWRSNLMITDLKVILDSHLSNVGQKHLKFIFQALDSLIDIIFIPPLFVALINPFLKGRRLVCHMQRFSILAWRRLILDEFFITLLDLPAFVCLTLSLATLVEMPFALTLYKAILRRTKPVLIQFNEKKQSKDKENDSEKCLTICHRIFAANKEKDSQCQKLSFMLIPLLILDLLLFIANVLLLVSVYRYASLRKEAKLKQKALEVEMEAYKKHNPQQQIQDKLCPLTYAEHRKLVHMILSMEIELQTSLSAFFTYPLMVLYQVGLLFLDIPFIILSLLLLIVPWRARHFFKEAFVELQYFWKMEYPPYKPSFRFEVLIQIVLGILDYFHLLLFLISFTCSIWRFKYIASELKLIFRSDAEDVNKRQIIALETKMKSFYCFTYVVLKVALGDILCIPLILPLVPFYILCIWRLKLLIKCWKVLKLNDFSSHRTVCMHIGLICILDFFDFIPLVLSIITVYRVPTLLRMLKSMELKKQKDQSKETSHLLKQEDNNSSQKSDGQKDQKANQDQNQSNQNSIEQVTCSEIIEKEFDITLLIAGRKCLFLLTLDLLSITPMLLIYINYDFIKRLKRETQKLHEKRKGASDIEGHYQIEKQIIFMKFKTGGFSLLYLILKAVGILLLILLVWRSPTLIILIIKPQLQENLGCPFNKSKARKLVPKAFMDMEYNEVLSLVWFCFKHFFIDLIYTPLYLALMVITVWRSWPVLKHSYKYDNKSSISDQIREQRVLVVKQLWQGLKDVYALFCLFVISMTLFRLPFFFMIIAKNLFPNSKLSRRLFYKNIPQENLRKMTADKKLPLDKCINFTFKELLQDLLYIPFGIILIVLAPWRLFSLYHIFWSQLDRIPTHDPEAKNVKLSSKRRMVLSLLCSIITCDYSNLVRIITLIARITPIPTLIKMLFKYMFNSGEYQTGEFSFSEEINRLYLEARSKSLRYECILIILVCMFRIRNTLRRIQILRKNNNKEYKPRLTIEKTKYEKKLDKLSSLQWNVYSLVPQYLTIKDISNLSQVNKSLYHLNQNDQYWRYIADRDHPNLNKNNNYASWKEKYIKDHKELKIRQMTNPVDKQKLDSLYGINYILLDEAVKSLRSIPNFLLLPAKLICYLIFDIIGTDTKFNDFVPKRSEDFIDLGREYLSQNYERLENQFPKFKAQKTFKKIHYGVNSWLGLIIAKYVCEVGYILSRVACFMIQITSAGEVSPIKVEVIDGTFEYKVTFTKNKENLGKIKNRLLGFLLYVSQCAFICINVTLTVISLVAPSYVLKQYFGWQLHEAVFGPCFVLLIHYSSIVNLVATQVWYIKSAAPFFRPYRAITEIIAFICFLSSETWVLLGNMVKAIFSLISRVTNFILKIFKKVAKFIANVIIYSWKSLVQGLRFIIYGIKTSCIFIFNQILSIIKGSYQGYAGILVIVTKFTLQFGAFGDILLTPFALLWMLWPAIILYFIPNRIYFIPCGILSLTLVFIGYRRIQQVVKVDQK